MTRREFMALLGGAAAAWSLAARAQQAGKVWRIGFVAGGERAAVSHILAGFPQGMRELGYAEGRDFTIEWRFAEGNVERFSEFAAELVRLRVDAIVVATAAAVRAVQQATNTIPIIMSYSTDPVGNGFVVSLARPGGNTTGLASSTDDTAPKQLELLTTIAPSIRRVGLLGNPNNPNHSPVLQHAQAAARTGKLVIVPAEARTSKEIESAFAALLNDRVEAIMGATDALFVSQRLRIAQLALQARLPSMFVQREFVEAGALMSYGESIKEFNRRAASFVDKIFKGAKPGDLPIEQPTRFHLVINRKTADALGLTIPPQLYILADEVIE
jgi:putative tryptophan/tyrosine transport system substrate-binding protein